MAERAAIAQQQERQARLCAEKAREEEERAERERLERQKTLYQKAAEARKELLRVSQSLADLRAKQAELALLKSPPKPEEVAEAEARIAEEESLLMQARQTLTRTQSLYDQDLAPQSSLEVAQTTVSAREARLESARQATDRFEA